LNFIPNSIKIYNASSPDDNNDSELKTTYHKASGIVDIIGRFPKVEALKTVKCKILLEAVELEK